MISDMTTNTKNRFSGFLDKLRGPTEYPRGLCLSNIAF